MVGNKVVILFILLVYLARSDGSCQDGSCESVSFDIYLWPLWLIPCLVLVVPCIIGGLVIACRELGKRSGIIHQTRPNRPIARISQSFDNPDLHRTLRHCPHGYTEYPEADGYWYIKHATPVNTSSYPYLTEELPPPNYSQLLTGHKTE